MFIRLFHTLILCMMLALYSLNAATFTVNSSASTANSSTDGVCDVGAGVCTLEEAIREANANPPATINFSTKFQGTSQIGGCLTAITGGNITIDASSQWDSASNRPGVEIVATGCDLMTIASSNNSVYGLYFSGGTTVTPTRGIYVLSGDSNIIGGSGSGQRNVFLVSDMGIEFKAAGALNRIRYNYFGTIDGDTLPGADASGYTGEIGIYVNGASGASIISNNLIVAQSECGVALYGTDTILHDNEIGINIPHSKSLANKDGVCVYGIDHNVTSNFIAGNNNYGVYLYHATRTTISSNNIGYGLTSIGNDSHGVFIDVLWDGNNSITNNNIRANGGSGIYHQGGNTVLITGNEIEANSLNGIHIVGSSAIIGGETQAEANGIFSNTLNGIRVESGAAIIKGNYIGLSLGIYDKGNKEHGILLDSGTINTEIGGENSGARNWIGWNLQDGIHITGSGTSNNFVINNVIGAPNNWGGEAPNGHHGIGIYDQASSNTIGGLGGGNIILSSGWSGIAIVESSNNNSVISNSIGTNGSSIKWGNNAYGINVVNSTGNTLSFNEIAYNADAGNYAGISINGATATGNQIRANSIHDNKGKGIELLNSANNSISAPVLNRSGKTVSGTTCFDCTVEFFTDNANEGKKYEGSTIADGSGNFSWEGSFTYRYLTATATDASLNSSEFSTPINGLVYLPFIPLLLLD